MSYHFKRKAFYAPDGKRCKGITKLLKKHVGIAPPSLGEAGGGGGLKRGKTVDREISAFISRGSAPKHPLSKAFFALLRKLKLKAIKSQVVCGIGQIATACDVIAKDADGTLVLIEQKCGYQNCRDTNKNMKGVLKDLKCTANNCAFAQLGMTKYLYEECFGKKVKAIYIRLHNKGASVKKLPPGFGKAKMKELLEIFKS
jgi:hypothetical protein